MRSHKLKSKFYLSFLLLILFSSTQISASKFEDNPVELQVYKKIQEVFQKGNIIETRRLCLKFIKEFKGSIRNAEIHYLLGETEQRFFESIFHLRKVTKTFPTSYWALKSQLAISLKYYMIGNYKKAEKELKLFIDRYPDSKDIPKAYYFRSLAVAETGDYNKAIKLSNRIIALYPKSPYAPKTFMNLGQMYYKQKKYQQAVAHFKIALPQIKSRTLKPILLQKLGDALIKIGRKTIALKHLKQLTKDFPETKEAKRAKNLYFN